MTIPCEHISTAVSEYMSYEYKKRLQAASVKAKKLFPEPVATVIADEIMSWESFGYRFGGFSRIRNLVEFILKTPIPEPEKKEVEYEWQ